MIWITDEIQTTIYFYMRCLTCMNYILCLLTDEHFGCQSQIAAATQLGYNAYFVNTDIEKLYQRSDQFSLRTCAFR